MYSSESIMNRSTPAFSRSPFLGRMTSKRFAVPLTTLTGSGASYFSASSIQLGTTIRHVGIVGATPLAPT
jgi:hypothetical protein